MSNATNRGESQTVRLAWLNGFSEAAASGRTETIVERILERRLPTVADIQGSEKSCE